MTSIMKIRVTIEAEYETDPTWYQDGATPLQMAQTDLDNDPGAFLSEADVKITKAEKISS